MFGFLSRIRFLPITIFAIVLMLTVKVSDIWEGVEDIADDSLNLGGAAAQTAEGELSDSIGTTSLGAMTAVEDEDFSEDLDPFSLDEDFVEAEAQRWINKDPTLLTQAEIALLQRLVERREQLEEQSTELDLRRGMLQAAEERIDDKIKQLRAFQETIEGLIDTYDEQQMAKVQSLVKIYENMKPKDAARIFEELEMDTLLLVAERMKERKLAVVMANMNPEKARDVTVELARLRSLPEPGSMTGG